MCLCWCRAREVLEYEKKRCEERATVAEQWRQKESQRAKKVRGTLEQPS
jgi:hypothetical protein